VNHIPDETIRTFARTIFHESQKYGFGSVDVVRLINALMDMTADSGAPAVNPTERKSVDPKKFHTASFPLRSERIQIRKADRKEDQQLIESWIADQYGQYFLLSCVTAQRNEVISILTNPANEVGIVSLAGGKPIGAVAFLDINHTQRRAELRKLIGVASERGKGYAEEATALWIAYGRARLALEKIYLSTLETHLRNIQLNESIGFRIEGVLRGEILLGDKRQDVLRMGLCFEPSTHQD
jgi:RimJ/RimL family protein N-acetyltransferase